MYKINRKNDKVAVTKDGKKLNILDFDETLVRVEADLGDLKSIDYDEFPNELHLELNLEIVAPADTLIISKTDGGFNIFYFNSFNSKYWCGFVGQSDYLSAFKHLLEESKLFEDINLEGDDDPWQHLSFNKEIGSNENLFSAVEKFATDVKAVVNRLDEVTEKLKTDFSKIVSLS